MNGVEENLEYLQTVKSHILNKDVFLSAKGLTYYEEELNRRRGQIGIWLEYISKIRGDILITKEKSYHELGYVVSESDLTTDISKHMNRDQAERMKLSEFNVKLMYKHDYCLIVIRRALSSSSRRDPSIWKEYLNFLENYELFLKSTIHKELININISEEYETCLKSCNEPDFWICYSRYLFKTRIELTKSRHVLDRSLRSLPVEVHHKIWEQYLEYIFELKIPILSISVLKRFLMFSYKEGISMYIQALLDGEKFDDCLNELLKIIQKDEVSIDFKREIILKGIKYQIMKLDDIFDLSMIIISENILFLDRLKIKEYIFKLLEEKLKRSDRKVYFEDINSEPNNKNDIDTVNHQYKLSFGDLIDKSSQIYMKLADWEQVYNIYYYGIENCQYIYDFITIYDSMMLFSSVYMDRLLSSSNITDELIQNEFTRLEKIIDDHKYLLYKILIKKDQNNITRWIEYINVFIKDQNKKNLLHPSIEVVKVFEEAIETIDFNKIKDRNRCIFWVYYANYMTCSIDNGNEILKFDNFEGQDIHQCELLDLSRDIFERSLSQSYIEDYTLIWTEWIEMELRFGNYEYSLNLIRRCMNLIKEQKDKKTASNYKIWQLASDIEISFGTIETVRILIEELFENGMLTSSLVISFGEYFKENNYFEETFALYERALSSLTTPYTFKIWLEYISSFISHYNDLNIIKLFDKEDQIIYGNNKIDRLRDIFEYCIFSLTEWKSNLRPKDQDYYYECIFIIYSIYSAYESKVGRVKRAFEIYEKAIEQLDDYDNYKTIIYIRFINLSLKCMDISHTRTIFDKVIEELKTADLLIKFCLKYINFELNMGEVNRVRALFMYASDFIPNIYLVSDFIELYNKFWSTWNDFELEYGNEDTFKDMLRVKKNIPLVSGHVGLQLSNNINYFSKVNVETTDSELKQNEEIDEPTDQDFETSNTFVETDSDDDLLLSLSSSELDEDNNNQENDEDDNQDNYEGNNHEIFRNNDNIGKIDENENED